jgi:hypothetical protein
MTFSVNKEGGDSGMTFTKTMHSLPDPQEGHANRDSVSFRRNFSKINILSKNMNNRHMDIKKAKK